MDINNCSDLIQILKFHAFYQPDKIAYTFLSDIEKQDISISYKELEDRVKNIASILINTKASNNRVLILYPPGIEYITVFLGCLYANFIAIPCYPSYKLMKDERISSIIEDAKPGIVIRKEKQTIESENVVSYENMVWLNIEEEVKKKRIEVSQISIDPESIAFLQYTSGSTSLPKGVMVSHKNLVHNLGLIQSAFELTQNSSVVLWLPPFHDMGLIGGILEALYVGYTVHLMPSVSFIRKPAIWLEAIMKYNADTSGAPNFAYDLCVDRITEEQKEGLDLSNWTMAFSGAEPIRESTLTKFYEAFKKCGFSYKSFYSCYGLAEATLMVSGSERQSKPLVQFFDKECLQRNEVALTKEIQDTSIPYVSCGKIVKGLTVHIVNPNTFEKCISNQIGEIWVKGESVAKGYWNRSDEENKVFHGYIADAKDGPYLRTGDLGVILEGELFVTGRHKDLIIIRGKNYYPQDIELVVESCHPLLAINSGVAFSVEEDNEEKLVITYEIIRSQRNEKVDINEIAQAVRQAVFQRFSLQVYDFVLLKPKEVLKTTSGKVRRSAVKERYLRQKLNVIENDKSIPISKHSFILSALTGLENEEARGALISTYLQQLLLKVTSMSDSILDINQDFGNLGMDSIKIIELGHLLEEKFEVIVPFELLYENATILKLANYISLEINKKKSDEDNFKVLDYNYDYSLSRGQKALWFLYKLDSSSVAYNISSAMSLDVCLDENALQEAYRYLKNQHPLLNSIFSEIENEPYQKINPQIENDITIINAENWTKEEVTEFLNCSANTPFQLLGEPLIRICLLKVKDGKSMLLFVLHHIIADFWALSVLLKDFIAFYSEILAGKEINLYDNSNYMDYIRMQENYISSEKGKDALDFFRGYLEGCPPKINLPLDFPRPNIQTFHGKVVRSKINHRIVNQLNHYSKIKKSTTFTTLLTSFFTLLYHFSNDKDIVVGVPIAARNRATLSNMVGYCTNMLPIRMEIEDKDMFGQLLDRVHKNITEVFSYQEYPFSTIVENLQINRDISYSSIYQVAFVYQQSSLTENKDFSAFALGAQGYEIRLEGYHMESLPLEQEGAPFDLTFMLADTTMGLEVSVRYNSDIFQEAAVSNMLRAYEYLLTTIFDNERVYMKNIQLYPKDILKTLIDSFHKPFKEFRYNGTFQDMFMNQAKWFGGKPAIIFHQKPITYRELNEKSSVLAQYLIGLGVKQDVLVSIFMDRSPELFISILGVLKAGGAYVPVDISYPKNRVKYMIEDSNSSVIITKRSLAKQIPVNNNTKIVFIEEVAQQGIELLASSDRNQFVGPENLSYLIYTSGSTGEPKGVMITHKSLTNFILSVSEEVNISGEDISISLTTASFDMFVFDSLLPLAKGLTVVLPDEVENKDTKSLISLISDNKVSIMQTTPSKFRMMLGSQKDLSYLKSLKIIVAGGEPFSYQLLQTLSRFNNYKIYNGYGPTEATVFATMCELSKDSKITIGKPMQNTSLCILNADLNPVPVGVVGELYISGVGLAKGYYNKPELTKEKFIQNPVDQGQRMYKTGDQARWLPEGNIEYLGRMDNQIKIRGFRIEIGEIEKKIMSYTGIEDTAVIDKEDELGNKYLCAYLVASQKVLVNQLSAFLSDWLPHYMIPSYFVQIETVPTTPNGKIDRKELMKLSHSFYIQDTFTNPEDQTQEIIKEIWKEILPSERLSTTSSFFLSGGDSLKATSLVNRIQSQFHISIPLSDVFRYSTIKEQGEYINNITHMKKLPIEPKVYSAYEKVMEYPSSLIQKRVYLAGKLDDNQLSYNMPGVIVMKGGAINKKRLEDNLIQLIDRHESLRTSFVIKGEEVIQRVHEKSDFQLETATVEEINLNLLEEEFIRPFSLEAHPLIRAKLVSNGDMQILLIDVHHIIMDGTSLNILIRELVALYKGEELAPLIMQYKDFTQWQNELLSTEYMKQKEAYWMNQLEDTLPSIGLPYDYAKTEAFSFEGDSYKFFADKELTIKLNELSNKTGATLYMTLLSGFYVLLSSISGQSDIVIGTLAAGRNHSAFEETIGMFVNTILLRNIVDLKEPFRNLLEQVKINSLSAFENQEYPFEQLIKKLGLYQVKASNPLVEVMFIFQNNKRYDFIIDNVEFKVEEIKNKISKFNLTLEVKPESDIIEFKLEYRTDLFKAETIKNLALSYIQILEQVANDVYIPVGTIAQSKELVEKHLSLRKSEKEKELILPENEMEEMISNIWKEILKLKIVSTSDLFFSLGGDSLKAFRVIHSLQNELHVEIPYKEFFKHPTIKQMSDYIIGKQRSELEIKPQKIFESADIYEPFALSDLQEAYWLGRKKGYELGNIAAHAYIEMDLEDLNMMNMQNAILKLIKRHPMLRAVILPEGIQEIKHYEEVSHYQLELTDIVGWQGEKAAEYLDKIRTKMSHQILESDKWPLFDIKLTKWNDEKTRVHFSIDLLIVDAFSLRILLSELSIFYKNPSMELPEIAFAYKDYILYMNQVKESDGYQKSLTYWKGHIKDIYPAPQLPQVKNYNNVESPIFVRRTKKIDCSHWNQFKEKAASYQVTPTVALAAAYANILSLWSKNKKFTINMTKFSRPIIHEQINWVVGDFTSLILLDVDASKKIPFKDFVLQLQDCQMESMDHSEVDAVSIMREYAKQRDLLGKASMPVVFTSIMDGNVDQDHNQDFIESTFEKSMIYALTQTPQVILDNQVIESYGELRINWDAIEELFPQNLLDDMFEAYCDFIDLLGRTDEFWQISIEKTIHMPKYQQDMIEKPQDTIHKLDKGLLYDSFLNYVDKTPAALAVVTSSMSLTYKELYERADEIRNWVASNSKKEEFLVAVVLEKGWEQVASILGILMAGAAYLPIDPNMPQERMRLILQNAGVITMITKTQYYNKFHKDLLGLECLFMDRKEDWMDIPVHDNKRNSAVHDLAYVIYTSGSTGQPKGVMIEHEGVVNTINDINTRFSIGGEDRVLQISALNFDLSVYDIFGMLSVGGSIIIPEDNRLLDPSHWHQLIEENTITVWNTVPAYMEMYIEYLTTKSISFPQSLRLVLMSGDKIPMDLPKKIYSKSNTLEVVSLGGATEVSIWSILYSIDQNYNDSKNIPYGKSMYNQICYVMDRDYCIQPIWVPGEIYIGGKGVARGYYGDPQKTKERFVINPNTGERLYKTGDIGSYNMDKNIEFLGREDNQVKIRGYRIELGEIETVLNHCPNIEKSAVTVIGTDSKDMQVVAYYVPSKDSKTNTGIITNPLERLNFKMSHFNIRTKENTVSIKFNPKEMENNRYISRRSYRKFQPKFISFDNFSKLMDCLKSITLDKYPLPKYQYASAGSLYPVQAYVYIKADAVEGISEGIYYYNPTLNEFSLIELGHNMIQKNDFSSTNGEIFDTGAFTIFLIGEMNAIYPMYGEWSKNFSLIECGSISQLLEMQAEDCQIGLCQVGGFDFDRIRSHFKLSDSQIYLHSMIGGYIDSQDKGSMEQFLLDNRNTIELFKEAKNMELGNQVILQSSSNAGLEQDIITYAKEHLPDYMVPKTLVPLDQLPLSTNGKIDYKQLPKVERKAKIISESSCPKSQTEIIVSNIWKEILGIGHMNVEDNIFDIGGTSIQLMRIHNRLCKEFLIDIPIVQMFVYTTIKSLSEYLDQYKHIPEKEVSNNVSGYLHDLVMEECQSTQREVRMDKYKQSIKKRGLQSGGI